MFTRRVLAKPLASPLARSARAPVSAVRSYATPAADTKPPVALFGVDGTYASALYTAAAKQSTLDPTARALESLHRAFVQDPKLTSILAAPSLSPGDKQQLVAELLKTSGAPASDKTMENFLDTLAANNRLKVLPGVSEKFAELMSAHKGEVELRVTSAAPLDAKVIRQLETAVGKSQYVGQGKKLKTVTKVTPDIKGGLIVEVGDRTIDLSVSARMSRMNKLLQDNL
ncbi:MAG: ATP synthase F0 subcomplex subunit OSCP atp5 [Chrysothrix sp. TS-e1954]|nr:MAG: ATP synthase F0 subcomplex subunit OSCP atp5 [Chrysothrix sp. TS-e1954]